MNIQMPKFTQYYIVSIILPGIVNGLSIFNLYVWLYRNGKSCNLNPEEWIFLILVAIILTYMVGMIFEKFILWLITGRFWPFIEKIYSKDRSGASKLTTQWRNELITLLKNNPEKASEYKVICVEKIMSEYYFFNNIIPGITAGLFMCIVYLVCAQGIWTGEKKLLYILLLWVGYYFIFYGIAFIIRTWLKELEELLK